MRAFQRRTSNMLPLRIDCSILRIDEPSREEAFDDARLPLRRTLALSTTSPLHRLTRADREPGVVPTCLPKQCVS